MNKEENELLTGDQTEEEIKELEEEYKEPPKAESENNAYVFPMQTYEDRQKSIQKHAKESRSVKVVASEDEFVMPKESYKESVKNSRKREKAAAKREREAQMAGMDEDNNDYIATRKRKSHHHRHHHHHHHHHHGSSMHSGTTRNNNTGEAKREAMDGYVFRTPYRKSHRKKKRRKSLAVRILTIALIAILGIVIASGATFLILRQIGDSQMHNYEEIEIVIPEDSEEIAADDLEILNEGKVITYNGDTYELNEKVSSVVLIGVDDSIEDDEAMMSDAIYIVAIDSGSNRVSMIPVSRDTMTDIDVYSTEGSFIDTEKMQLSYAYSFTGDGKNGAQNTTAALSKLFFGMPFNNYFAMDMDALVTLNDAIGGVTLIPTMTFTSPIDGSTIKAGESVTLFGKEAEEYIRSRDMSELESNNDRMARQIQYIQAFLNSAIPAAKSDISIVGDLYGTIRVNSETSLTVPQMTYLASSALSLVSDPSQIEYKSIDGEMKAGEHAEFYPSDQSVLELMLDIFYRKK